MNPTNETPQKKLFKYLKNVVPPEKNLADCVSEWLHVSSDSAYRRIRGETPLTTDELMVIAEATGLSANDLLGVTRKGAVLFESTRAGTADLEFTTYLKQIHRQLSILDALEEKEIMYCSKDLPIFHFFMYPELMAFKFHFWMQIIVQQPSYQDKAFAMEMPEANAQQLMQQAAALYTNIPGTEIWNTESISSSLFQIEYYRTAGLFANAADIRALYSQLQEMIFFVGRQAELATKFLPDQNPATRPRNFQLFYNQVCLSDNTMLANTPEGRVAVINYGVLNYLTCHDQEFCAHVAHEVDNIIKRSTKLSDGNMRHRTMFFNAINEKINRYKKLV